MTADRELIQGSVGREFPNEEIASSEDESWMKYRDEHMAELTTDAVTASQGDKKLIERLLYKAGTKCGGQTLEIEVAARLAELNIKLKASDELRIEDHREHCKTEDALRARIAELEADQTQRIERAAKYMNRVAELEEKWATVIETAQYLYVPEWRNAAHRCDYWRENDDLRKRMAELESHVSEIVQERIEELDAEGEAFDRECWNVLRKLCEETPGFDWRDYFPDGMTADMAYEFLSESRRFASEAK